LAFLGRVESEVVDTFALKEMKASVLAQLGASNPEQLAAARAIYAGRWGMFFWGGFFFFF
jgi:hypothetical protein